MEPLYSILLCNQSYLEYSEKIEEWLFNGVKVIWFSQNESEVNNLKTTYNKFAKALLLQAFVLNITDQIIIIDGRDDTDFICNRIESVCPLFNSAQYRVEHCNADEHIVVQASAGTGKTTVMVDRVLYLLHTQPDLRLNEIYMITFTNYATEQMNKKIQDVLMMRFQLTHNNKYLHWLEEQSQLHVSTIHSFAYNLLREFGIGEGFTRNLSIRSLLYEKKEIIKDIVDEKIDESKTVIEQLGIPFYKANNIMYKYWNRFLQLGISREDISQMDWGEAKDEKSQAFHNLIVENMSVLEDIYHDTKIENDMVSIDDIMRDLEEVLMLKELPCTDIKMKYLFIDEFQDSDLSQIRVACHMVKLFGAALFVVGDIKQSIYRFRGANNHSFKLLKNYMQDMRIKSAVNYELINNYRTAANVMNKMDQYFRVWGEQGYLQYGKSVIPFNSNMGRCKMIYCGKNNSKSYKFEKILVDEVGSLRDNLLQRIQEGTIGISEKTRVVILARSHRSLSLCENILRKNRIPVTVQEDGSFYASEAVRDFYLLVCSFMFPDEPKHIFNYLMTPYAGDVDPMNINEMEKLHGDYDNLVEYLSRFLEETDWQKYYKEMRLKPILSVFKHIIDEIPIIDNYIMKRKTLLDDLGWSEKNSNAQILVDSRRYQANLEKLLDIIQRMFGGEKVSIYDIYTFLNLNIATNRSESEEDFQAEDNYSSILCMTVHKSKGLEFDTVIIPITDNRFCTFDTTEVIIDPVSQKVAWKIEDKVSKYKDGIEMENTYYKKMKKEDNEAVAEEETRILYVAMTRAINNLVCLVPDVDNNETWAAMIQEVGVDYE